MTAMNAFIDIHQHCLYGVDDGAATKLEMQNMLLAAHADGIRVILATPHIAPGIKPFSVELYKAQIEEADAFAKAKNLDLRVYSGAEILYGFQTRRFLSEHRLPTLADSGKVLLEFCLDVKYPEIENAVLTVLRTGHLPVLAHIERYPCLMQKARGLRLLKKQYDVSCQVNADSVLRNWNSVMSGAMKRAIADGTIDFVASDAHSPRSGAYAMQKAYAKLEQHFGADLADRLTGNHKTVEWFGNL